MIKNPRFQSALHKFDFYFCLCKAKLRYIYALRVKNDALLIRYCMHAARVYIVSTQSSKRLS